MRQRRSGLSLGEVLIVIAIIGILLGLLLPATRRVREAGPRAVCMNNMRQVSLGLLNYESNAYKIPFAAGFPTGCIGPGDVPEDRLSWMVAILPYVEQDAVSRQFMIEKGWSGNETASKTMLKTYLCPSANVEAFNPFTCYVAMAGIGPDATKRPAGSPGNGFMGDNRVTDYTMFPDGTANTIAFAETRTRLGPWARGGDSTLRGYDPAAPEAFDGHKKLFHVAMVDGSVRSVRSTVDSNAFAAWITIAGGESLTDLE